MQKVLIKNLGPIKECCIEIKRLTILIGESGTGKSVILRTISMLKWIYKRMQYKTLFKSTKIKNDALRFRLKSIIETSLLEDFFDKASYIEFQIDGTSFITIKDNSLKVHYKNIKDDVLSIDKIVFLNDNRSAIPEILSSAGGRRAKFSYYTTDMIDNFLAASKSMKEYNLSTMDITLMSKNRVGYKQFYIKNKDAEIKLENASSGEKSLTIMELIIRYFAKEYSFDDNFISIVIELASKQIEVKSLDMLQKRIINSELKRNLTYLIEEPETNLFPIKQKKILEFLIQTIDTNTKGHTEVILSTHSPYILTSLNNLIYAKELNKNNTIKSDIFKNIGINNMIDLKDVSVYITENGIARNIIDSKTGLIDADAIDGASENIMNIFNELLALKH